MRVGEPQSIVVFVSIDTINVLCRGVGEVLPTWVQVTSALSAAKTARLERAVSKFGRTPNALRPKNWIVLSWSFWQSLTRAPAMPPARI